MDVIEHLSDPVGILHNVLSKIRTKGYLIISTPKIDSFFAAVTKAFWPFMTPPEHIGFLTEKSFRYIAENLELEILEDRSKGKLVNAGFLFYKINRIIPWLAPKFLVNQFNHGFLSRIAIYVPTNDIRYLVLKKL